MDLVTVVGNIAVVCTILSSFSGIPVCLEFFKKRSTSSLSVLPFLTGATCCCLWLQFSLLVDDNTLKFVNVVATSFQIVYLTCFYINTHNKKSTLLLSLLVFIFLLSNYTYSFHVINKEKAVSTTGYLAATGSILASAAPLAGLAEVIRSKSSESLPGPVIFSTFVVTSLWYIYGILVNNSFIQVPNFIGAVLSGLQLGIIGFYPKKTTIEKKVQ